jgi:pimeloyl-ACP methyl ester carboxylesterase
MLHRFAFWLACFELLARQRRWHGLRTLGNTHAERVLPLAALLLTLPQLRRAPVRHALTALPALIAHAAFASLRNHTLDPLRRLVPGHHADRHIDRVDIAMETGHMPALHITPHAPGAMAVCVLHGSGCDKTYYAWRMADAFVSRGIAVLLVDLDGHGESPRIQQFPDMLDNAVRGVEWLHERYAQVGLVGVSLGGCLAARAVADGLAVDALALLEAPPYLHFTPRHVRREALALGAPFLLDLFGESTPFHLGATIYDLVRVQRVPRIRCTIGTVELIAALDLAGSLARITAPVLLVYGERDAIVRPDQAALVRGAAPPHALFVTIPEASHLSLILHPGALERLGSWMAGRLAARQAAPAG